MMISLEGKVAIVTGGAKGLGRAFCEGFAKQGAKVLAVTRKDISGLEETVKSIRALGGEGEYLQIDVTSRSDTEKMAKFAMDRFGRIDILVNNAAFYYGVERKGFDKISDQEWDMMM
jgi:NAD(P)-dependent dehydrogenase (short-subunit alcohol dehydrogenase family)